MDRNQYMPGMALLMSFTACTGANVAQPENETTETQLNATQKL
jgi:hypothetical protein